MGKRKSRAKPPTRKLETLFCCPFCNHGDSVECTIDLKIKIGEATCSICHESYSTTANACKKPIDIYTEWIAECEWVNQPKESD